MDYPSVDYTYQVEHSSSSRLIIDMKKARMLASQQKRNSAMPIGGDPFSLQEDFYHSQKGPEMKQLPPLDPKNCTNSNQRHSKKKSITSKEQTQQRDIAMNSNHLSSAKFEVSRKSPISLGGNPMSAKEGPN